MTTAPKQQCCFNPNCSAGVVVYTARGLALHLQHSLVCQQFAIHLNVDPTNARKVAFQSRLDISGQYANPMDWTTSTNATKPPRRPLVNPRDPWPTPYDDNESSMLHQTIGFNEGSRATLAIAHASAVASANGGDEVEFLDNTIDPSDASGTNYADPFAHLEHGDDDTTTAVAMEQRCMVKLLKLLEDMDCPDYALAQVIDWAHDAYQAGFEFSPTVKSRDGVLAGLYYHAQNAKLLLPSVVPVELIGMLLPVDMIVYDFAAQYLSLFHSKVLMQRKNVNIDPQHPFAPYVPPDGLLGEVHSGAMYRKMYNKYISLPHKQLLAPLMLYGDKCHITNGSSRFGLEPITMTSSIFTEGTRRHSSAHRVLGFIHQVLKSTAENTKQNTSVNVQNYHRQLDVMFRGLRLIQEGIDKRLQGVTITIYDDVEGDVTFVADLVVPINIFIADTPAANIVCGHYDNHHPSVQRHHHMCDANFDDLPDADNVCTFVDAQVVFDVQATGSAKEQKALSVKPVVNAFKNIQVCLPSSSILRATTTETMHSVRQGMMRRTNALLFMCLNTEELVELDNMARRFNTDHRQSVRQSFPRASFVKGITSLAKLSAEEQVGVTMTMVCIMQQHDGWILMSDALSAHLLDAADVLQLLECLLVFDAWTRQPTFWRVGDLAAAARVESSIRVLMKMVQERLPRDKGNGWNIPTFHSLQHLVREIIDFGAPMNYCAERAEANHSVFAKRPGRRSQKRYASYERQVATRICDSTILNHCHRMMFPSLYCDNEDTECDVLRIAGTRWTVTGNGTAYPPTVVWHSKTCARFLQWPAGLARWMLKNYNASELHGCTELLGGTDQIRCHPGYRGAAPWYDWVMIKDTATGTQVPAKIWTIVKTADETVELIATIARQRTGADSVLFTEWKYMFTYEAITVSQLVEPVFIVKNDVLTISTMCPQHSWNSHFTNMSDTLTKNR